MTDLLVMCVTDEGMSRRGPCNSGGASSAVIVVIVALTVVVLVLGVVGVIVVVVVLLVLSRSTLGLFPSNSKILV